MDTTNPKIAEQYKKLPKKLKDVLFSEHTTDAIFAIGKENNLTVFQMGELADETGLIILGITKPEEYAKNLVKRLGLDAAIINKIVRGINEKIFNPVREELRAWHSGSAELGGKRSDLPLRDRISKENEPGKRQELPKPPATLPIEELPKINTGPTILLKQPTVMPKPSYSGRDPYHEAIDQEEKLLPPPQPPSSRRMGEKEKEVPLFSEPISSEKKISEILPSRRSDFPGSPRQSLGEAGSLEIGSPPVQRPIPTTPPKPSSMSWEDVINHPDNQKSSATSAPAAKSELERILNQLPEEPIQIVAPQKSNAPPKDPYREPIEN